ncbi:MAG TPA: MoaD/ThiS family protein [Nitrospira sp.]|nr:MoaD/ThiS family protein [Nitrospira sp.]
MTRISEGTLAPGSERAYHPFMQVQLSHPSKTVDVKGPKKVKDLLKELNLVVEAHLVIRGDELVTEDEMLSDKDCVEIRPVISGGDSGTHRFIAPFSRPLS